MLQAGIFIYEIESPDTHYTWMQTRDYNRFEQQNSFLDVSLTMTEKNSFNQLIINILWPASNVIVY